MIDVSINKNGKNEGRRTSLSPYVKKQKHPVQYALLRYTYEYESKLVDFTVIVPSVIAKIY